MEIVTLDAEQATAALPELIVVLRDAVDDGASVGYIAPLGDAEALAFWQGVVKALQGNDRVLFVARDEGRIVGTVQLSLERRPNGNHRGEVSKLLVHTSARNKGVGRTLMVALEVYARQAQRSLLVLDTVLGCVAEGLYYKLGFERAGIIPQYALSSGGMFEPTVVMYKQLE